MNSEINRETNLGLSEEKVEQNITARQNQLDQKQQKACENLLKQPCEENLWEALLVFAGYPFKTSKGLEFSYSVKGNEIFVDRKKKSLTRATVDMAFQKVLELGEGNLPAVVTGPKKLGTFGASYLYPLFIRMGIITH